MYRFRKLDYNLFELPDNVSFEEGTIIEPFSVAMHGINQIHVNKNDKVVIFGTGMIGLCALCACLSKGVKDIITHHYTLDQINEAFRMSQNRSEALKIQIDYD